MIPFSRLLESLKSKEFWIRLYYDIQMLDDLDVYIRGLPSEERNKLLTLIKRRFGK